MTIRRRYTPPAHPHRNHAKVDLPGELPDFADTLTSETENTLREWQLSSQQGNTHEARADQNAVLFMYANEMRDMKKSIAVVAEATRSKAAQSGMDEFKKELLKDTKETLATYRNVSITAITLLFGIVMFLLQKVYH